MAAKAVQLRTNSELVNGDLKIVVKTKDGKDVRRKADGTFYRVLHFEPGTLIAVTRAEAASIKEHDKGLLEEVDSAA